MLGRQERKGRPVPLALESFLPEVQGMKITIDKRLCKCCALCARSCPKSVYQISDDGRPEIRALDQCVGCSLCVFICPEMAIVLKGGAE